MMRSNKIIWALTLAVMGLLLPSFFGTSNARPASPAQGNLPITGVAPVMADGMMGVTSGTITAEVNPKLEHVGDSAPMVVVATAPVDASGHFVLQADPNTGAMASVEADATANNNGWVNMDLYATSADGKMTIQSIARRFVKGKWVGDTDPGTQVGAKAVELSPPSPGAFNPELLCTPYQPVLVGSGDTLTTIGELHTGDNQWATFYYGQTADSSVDVGIQTPIGGDWSVTGSMHVGNSNTAFAHVNVGEQWGYKIRTNMRYVKYRFDFPPGCRASFYKVWPDRWDGSTVLGENVHGLDNNCSNYPVSRRAQFYRGGGWGRSAYQFLKFNGAFSAFGFSAGAQSGSSSYVRANWSLGTRYTYYYYCGNDDQPFYSTRVFAGW